MDFYKYSNMEPENIDQSSASEGEQVITFPRETAKESKKPRVASEKQIAACRANAAKAREVRTQKLYEKLKAAADAKAKNKKKTKVQSESESSESEESDSDSEEEIELVTRKSGKVSRSALMQQMENLAMENAALKKAKKKASHAPVNVYVGGQDKTVTQAQVQSSWSDFN